MSCTVAVLCIDTGVDKVQCTNSGVEVSWTDSRGALMPDSSGTLHRYWSGQGAMHQFRSGGVLHRFSRSRPLMRRQ